MGMNNKFNPGDIIKSSDGKLKDMNEEYYLVESIIVIENDLSRGYVSDYILINLMTGEQEQCGDIYIERYYHQVA
jgi:hypothetical protein